MDSDLMLVVRDLTKAFRGLIAVQNVSFEVKPGEVVALIGPNGAGKTTCFNLIAGALKPSSGTVEFDGRPISGRPPEEIATQGLIRTFQMVRPMRGMSVLENAMVGAFACSANVQDASDMAYASLSRVGLQAKAHLSANSLTLPDRKMLELARAIAADPKLLLLDEVMAGLRSSECDQIVSAIKELNAEGMTILLIEHVMRVVMALAHRVIVLHHGQMIAAGTPAEIGRNPAVIQSYLGKRAKLT
jgi:branched-chain amino acid transport system ATP-binding protein